MRYTTRSRKHLTPKHREYRRQLTKMEVPRGPRFTEISSAWWHHHTMEVLDRVAEEHEIFLVTRHDDPIGYLVPLKLGPKFLGSS